MHYAHGFCNVMSITKVTFSMAGHRRFVGRQRNSLALRLMDGGRSIGDGSLFTRSFSTLRSHELIDTAALTVPKTTQKTETSD